MSFWNYNVVSSEEQTGSDLNDSMTVQNILGESKYKTFSNCFGHEEKKKRVEYYWDDPDAFEKEVQSFNTSENWSDD